MLNLDLLTLQQLLTEQGINAKLLNCSQQQAQQIVVKQVNIDSRNVTNGDLFIALIGERFDAHSFCAQAVTNGAVAVVVQKPLDIEVAQLLVEDTKLALGALATAWRKRHNIPLIAVTGSNGKTTVTQMLATILQKVFPNASLATKGNLNNEIGLPLTILNLQASDKAAVVELGMNHAGEINTLTDIALPTIALVNNAQREHQEFMQTVLAVAQENGQVLTKLPVNGVAVFPADDEYSYLWQQLANNARQLTFALSPAKADLVASQSWQTNHWQVNIVSAKANYSYKLYMVGKHNVRNSLAAFTCALALDIKPSIICDALEQFSPVNARSQLHELVYKGQQLYLIDDSYNANPDSVLAAIKMLIQLPAKQLLILGDMAEVGANSEQFHQEVGVFAKQQNIDLWSFGQASYAAGGVHFSSMEQLQQSILAKLTNYRTILVKGSRFMQMERVVQHILQCTQQNQQIGVANVS